jgi:hypothetical protein
MLLLGNGLGGFEARHAIFGLFLAKKVVNDGR